MAIGFSPIIPLDRVVPDPDARFQRFGVNDTQLFGKPLLAAEPNYRPSLPTWAMSSPATGPVQAPSAGAAPGPGQLVDLIV
jgi:hypothetical protein